MANNSNQPTILVKKADGTFARMTLVEVKAMQNSKLAPLVRPSPVKPSPKVGQASPHTLTTMHPQQGVRVKREWTREDGKSLLEERLPEDNSEKSRTSPSRINQVEEVIKKLDFKIAPDNNNRLRSIVQLRLKEVRGAEQTKETAMRRTIDGGLGLTESQADELEKMCGVVIAGSSTTVAPRDNRNKLPTVFHEPSTPANATPFNSFARKAVVKAAVKDDAALKLNTQPQTKRLMRDIIPPRIDEVGPVQEIRRLTLTDLRRLATNPSEAANRLKQKLINLRDESYLLYLEGLAAWRNSPLYLDYVKALATSLDRRQTLAALLTDKAKIQLSEIQAIIEMEKEL